MELDIQSIHSDLEDRTNALKLAEDHCRKAVNDAAKVADELRQEQDHSVQIEKLRKALEGQVKELQRRLDETEAAALQGGKKQIQALEQRLSEAEKEIEKEQQRHTETQKVIRKQERRIQELHFQLDESQKEQEKLAALAEKLQVKVQGYKKQAVEAEEIAALNVAKYRKLQQELEESEARAEIAESLAGQYRSKTRSSISRAESLNYANQLAATPSVQVQSLPGVTVKTTRYLETRTDLQ